MAKETTTPKRRLSLIQVGQSDELINPARMREMALKNPGEFARQTNEAIENGDLRWSTLHRSGVTFKNLFEALEGVRCQTILDAPGFGRRAINTGAFPLLTGNLTIADINDAYEAVPTIGQELVTDLESNKKMEVVARIEARSKDNLETEEGEDFPLVGAAEDWVTIGRKRQGARIALTQEIIEENDVSGWTDRINALADIAAEAEEEQTLERVTDKYGSDTSSASEPYVYHPQGSATALYNATANNPGTRAPQGTRVTNNAFADEANLEAARKVLAAMLNDRGKRMQIWTNDGTIILLCPDTIRTTVDKFVGSEMIPGTVNELNPYGPRGRYNVRVLSSPKLDDISTSAWYLGRFKKQFRRKVKLQMELMTLAMDMERYLTSRIAFQARVAWDFEIGATDYVYVVQNLEGTTYTP